MSYVYVYKEAIQNEQMLSHLSDRFNKEDWSEFEDFQVLAETYTEEETTICLIRFDQIQDLNKNKLHELINMVGKCKYIVIINPGQIGMMKRLMKTGTKSILLLDDPINLIIECIENTIRYGGYISPRIVALINIEVKMLVDLQNRITKRQRIIIQELLLGKSDKMIADLLCISYHTMKTHRKRLYKMFNVNSQGELFALLS